MKEAVVHPDTSVTIEEVPVPTPGAGEVLVRVVVFGTNPKDWKLPLLTSRAHNSGDDLAGVVEDVGEGVFEFTKGDRVAGFHVMQTGAAAFAEYAIAPADTVFRIPESTSFEEAATIPLTALTAVYGLFYSLGFPCPWTKKGESAAATPLVIYGASSAVGAYAIQLASKADIHPIIAVGSATSDFIRGRLDTGKGDKFIDYTAYDSPEAISKAIRAEVAVAGAAVAVRAFDAVSSEGTYDLILSKALAGSPVEGKKPQVAVVLPGVNLDKVDDSVDVATISVGMSHKGGDPAMLATVWSTLFGKGLRQGWLTPHPHEVFGDGLAGLGGALQALRNGEVRGKKMVGRVADTPGLKR